MSEDVSEIADEIKHLSSDEIEHLYKRYLGGEKNSELVKEYKIDINPNKLIRLLPPQRLDETLCPYCEVPMFTKRKSKSQSSWDSPPAECRVCDHKIFSNKHSFRQKLCKCSSCVIIRERAAIDAELQCRKLVRENYDLDDREPTEYTELNFSQKLVLLTLFRMQTDEDFDYILSLDDPLRIERLAPTDQMDIECLTDLFDSGVIVIDPESRIEAFVEEDEFKSFYLKKVRWISNVTLDGLERASLKEMYNEVYNELRAGIQSCWEEDIFELLFRISREETLQYVHVRADELNVNFTAENKTREIVDQLLQNFSVSEIYYFVKKSVENAHIYYSKGYANNKKHAGNTIPNKMLSLGERAMNEGWDTYRYNRDSRSQRSYISKIFYDFFLQDEDSGFNKAPGKQWEQELNPRYFIDKSNSEKNELQCIECSSKNVEVKMLDSVLQVNCKECGCAHEFTASK